jgi:MFS family permease
MMRLPTVWTTNLVSMLFGAAMFAVYAFLPQFVQIPASAGYGFGASVTTAGWLMFPMLAGMAVSGSFSGPLAARGFGFKSQIAWGSAAIAVASLALAFAHDTMVEVIVETSIVGIGLGFAYAAMVSLIVNSVPANQTGAATGMNSNLRTIGGGIGTAVMAAIVTAGHSSDGLPLEQGFTTGFAFFGVVAAAALVVALLIPSARPRQEPLAAPAVENSR